jgi:hypothetical protein
MDITELRVKALRQLVGERLLKDFANEHDLDASYLSQILNGHRAMGEKAAANMERKIGATQGYLVRPSASTEQPPAAAASRGDSFAIPVVARLISAAITDGRLTADDSEELRRLAIHLIKKNESSSGHVAVPKKLEDLADSIASTLDAGGDVDDMLKMLEHGMKKSRPMDSARKDELSKKKRPN